MKRIFIALTSIAALTGIAAFGATFFTPVQATTFSSARLIYVAASVGDHSFAGTAVPCVNLSGQNARITWSFFNNGGSSVGSLTLNVAHGRTVIVATYHGISVLSDRLVLSAKDFQGRLAVYSTQSGVFCSAILGHPTLGEPQGIELHMVRFNPHPGTVE